MLNSPAISEDKKQVIDAYLHYLENHQVSEGFIDHFANISNHLDKVSILFRLSPKRFLNKVDDIVTAIDSLNKSARYSEKVIRALNKGASGNDL
ncbi:MAG: hypothetical protein HWE27_17760 [Gammaproteobacteria bacterium]|nr:hypothetical protein [Gammaproteobacteria bacterium]